MNRAICSALVALAVLAGSVARYLADQKSSDAGPVFDVASVKPVDIKTTGGTAATISQMVRQLALADSSTGSLTLESGGRWLVRAATLRSMLQSVYPDYSRQGLIVGGPAWLDSQYFEIDARAPAGATPEDIEG